MPIQTGRNIGVNVVPETTFGVIPAIGTPGFNFRPNSGSLSLTKEGIQSGENRRDLQMTRGRHGSRSVAGNYVADMSLGTHDLLYQAGFRGTWDTPLGLSGLSLTADNTTKTFTRSAGSWIADGVKVGDVVRFGAFTTTANNNRNFRVTALTATVMTVAETPAAVGTAQTGVTLARPKKLLLGTASRSFSVEEVEYDIDASEVFQGVRVGQIAFRLGTNAMGEVTFSLVGQDGNAQTGANSPYFTNITSSTSIGMTAVEAVIRLGQTDVLTITGLDLSINLNAAGAPVVGSVITPDVFTNRATVEGSITAMREDITRFQSFLNEDQLSLHILFTENEAEPKDFISLALTNFSLSSATKSELGADGPRTQTLAIMPGIDERGGAFDVTTIKMQTSAL